MLNHLIHARTVFSLRLSEIILRQEHWPRLLSLAALPNWSHFCLQISYRAIPFCFFFSSGGCFPNNRSAIMENKRYMNVMLGINSSIFQ